MQRQNLKRNAPGAAPVPPQNAYPTQPGFIQPEFDWNQASYGAVPRPPNYDMPDLDVTGFNPTYGQTGSQELVRRNANQQLAPSANFVWENGSTETHDEEEELKQKALEARKEAELKKKTIPPFIVKLSR
jgi:heat shock transcription factor, other eukaryote